MPVAVETTSVPSNGPTANARRYGESGGVSPKRQRVRPPPSSLVSRRRAFAMATRPCGAVSSSAKRALKDGSSKQGKSRRDSAGQSVVIAYRSSPRVER